MTMQSLLHAVQEVAQLAGDSALLQYRTGLAVELKADASPVTEADRDAERRARAWIEARFPDDGILGEEFGEVRPGARRRWILDPIDGTKSFIRGVPLWGTLVAVCEGEEVLAGCIYCPAVGEWVAAARGEGAFHDGRRCRVSEVDSLGRATLLTSEGKAFPPFTQLAERAGVVRTWGDCFGYLLVATGRAEAMIDPVLAPWDAAALLPVILEAGGQFTDLMGRTTAFGGSAVATNAALAAQIRTTLQQGEAR